MALDDVALAKAARLLADAERNQAPTAPLTELFPGFAPSDAYQVQRTRPPPEPTGDPRVPGPARGGVPAMGDREGFPVRVPVSVPDTEASVPDTTASKGSRVPGKIPRETPGLPGA
jgi:hypothetical protein